MWICFHYTINKEDTLFHNIMNFIFSYVKSPLQHLSFVRGSANMAYKDSLANDPNEAASWGAPPISHSTFAWKITRTNTFHPFSTCGKFNFMDTKWKRKKKKLFLHDTAINQIRGIDYTVYHYF